AVIEPSASACSRRSGSFRWAQPDGTSPVRRTGRSAGHRPHPHAPAAPRRPRIACTGAVPPRGDPAVSVLSDLRTLVVHPGFRKRFTVRLGSQCGDGMVQVGLAPLFFFSPQNMATAGGVAAAFAVLLLPFTVVGPFAGPLLDRWRRRQVLFLGNAVRVVLALVLAVLIGTGGVTTAVYVLALVTLGVNRFLLAALSAGLPRVVPRDQLLIANTLTPTLGAVSAVVGAVLGLLIGFLVPDAVTDSAALVCAGLLFGAASALTV